MIVNNEGTKVSPKEKAKEIVKDAMENIEKSSDFLTVTSKNTEKEVEKIKDQMTKLKERINKLVKPAGK